MAEVTREKMSEIAEELRGTCKTLDEVLEGHGLDYNCVPVEMLDTLDEDVMLCDWCGWWVESSEIDDDSVCKECKEDE